VWALAPGQTQTITVPTGDVVLFDGHLSPKLRDRLALVSYMAPIRLASMVPSSGAGSYDPIANVLTVLGPVTVDVPPLTSDGHPLESRPIYTWKP